VAHFLRDPGLYLHLNRKAVLIFTFDEHPAGSLDTELMVRKLFGLLTTSLAISRIL